MQHTWIKKELTNEASVLELQKTLQIDSVLAQLLVLRGITTYDQAKQWFRPELSQLHNPFLMKDMDIAVTRLTKALNDNEKILIYGDYDVDGTTAVSLLYLFLKKHSSNIEFYIPDRYKEGYGISMHSIRYATEQHFTLIIALDCGIKAHDPIHLATENAIDVIVCDHHNQDTTLPSAIAVLNPKRKDCNYPCKELSGCGVGFKLLHGFCIKNNIELTELFEYLDIVAVSIASDIVKIIDENRILTYYGLQKINNNPTLGIAAIKQISNMQNNTTVGDIVFKIGPRINAAGRIDSGRLAVELLTCTDTHKVMDIVSLINQNNEQRKDIDKAITSEALLMLENDKEHSNGCTNVVYSPTWHKGVVGIVASRITETYYRPTIVLTESEGYITGSARSVDGFDLYAALEKCSSLLHHFGGHMYAAGLTLEKENYEAFKIMFEQVVRHTIEPDMLIPKIKIDAELDIDTISKKFYRILKQFEPFGPGNMTPIFVTKNVKKEPFAKTIGNNNNHLKCAIKQNGEFGSIDMVGFGLGHYVENIKHQPFDMCYSIEENEFRGNISLQLKIKDIKMVDENQ